MKYRCIVIAGLVMALALSGCGQTSSDTDADAQTSAETNTADDADADKSASREIFAMDTYMTVTAYGSQCEAAVEAAEDEINRLDGLISVGDEGSEIYQVNTTGSGVLSPELGYLVERSLELYESTDGLFDIAIYPIMDEWGFTTENYKVPDEAALQNLLTLTDASKINYDEESGEITFDMEGMQIDLGGIAKGYTSARIMDIYKEYGIKSGLVSLGGNVQLLGTKTDGSLWRVAIQSPGDDSDYIGVLSASDVAVITSGGYERYFEQDGKTYHHIIDPRTGYPSDSGLLSVTIVSDDGTLADGLSTSLFIMGKDQAAEYWRAHSDEFDYILMDENNEIYITEGIADSFESDYETHVVSLNE